MDENDPRRMQWGAPDELKWGEVISVPAAPQRDPLQAERDFLASMQTAHAPAGADLAPVVALRSASASSSPARYGEPQPLQDERALLADVETAYSPALPQRSGLDDLDDYPRALRVKRPRVASFVAGDSLVDSLRAALAQPFPRNLVIGFGIVPFVALLAGFVLQAVLAGGDWAHGGLAAGVDALLLAGAVAIGAAVRFALGRRGASFLPLGSALLVGLVVVGALGLAFSRQLHYTQALAAERSGAYAVAVAQYKLYGETAPNAPDLARAEAAWGEQLVAQKLYSDAALHLSNALADNPKDATISAQVSKDLYTVYSTWLAAGGDGMPYGDAASFFATYRTSSACDTTCQANAPQLQAQAMYLAGVQFAAAGDYVQATAQFDQLQAQAPTSSYAAKAHEPGAQAYLAWGQQLLKDANTCKGANSSSASLTAQYQTLLSAMQTLASKYGDTPEGQQGAQMLAAPQQVTGTLVGYPTNPVPTIHLSTRVDQTHLIFSNNYNVAVDAKTGAFTFPSVAPADYNLHTEQDVGYKTTYQIIHSSSGNLYNIHVGALCPLPLGSINY